MDKPLPTRLAAAGTDSAGPMTTGEFANRVAMLTEADSNIHAGELPLWYRLVPAKRASLGSRVFWMMSWCATLALLLAAILRLVDHDGNTLLTWVNAFTAYVYLSAYLVLVAALWTRRWRLAALSAVIVVCHVMWLAPDFASASTYPAAANDASPKVRHLLRQRDGKQSRLSSGAR